MNTQDIATRDRLLEDHLPLVRRLCRRFSHTPEPMEDLFQIGSIGLLKAIIKFDPDRGSDFLAFAVPLILGEIRNYFRDHGWAVKVPRKIQIQRRVVMKAIDAFTNEFACEPTVPQIAQATGLSEEEVYDTFEVGNHGKPLSLDQYKNGTSSGNPYTILDTHGREDPQLDALIGKIDLSETLKCLDKRERAIVYMKFYDELSQTEIAGRLDISQMHVSRLQRKALEKIREIWDTNDRATS